MSAASRAGTGNRVYDQRPARDRRINVLTVDCPTCHAGVGDRCTPQSHLSRRRMAIRLLHQDGSMTVSDLPLPSARKAMVVRRGLNLSRRQLSELIEVSEKTIATFELGRSLPTGDARARIAAWFAALPGDVRLRHQHH